MCNFAYVVRNFIDIFIANVSHQRHHHNITKHIHTLVAFDATYVCMYVCLLLMKRRTSSFSKEPNQKKSKTTKGIEVEVDVKKSKDIYAYTHALTHIHTWVRCVCVHVIVVYHIFFIYLFVDVL